MNIPKVITSSATIQIMTRRRLHLDFQFLVDLLSKLCINQLFCKITVYYIVYPKTAINSLINQIEKFQYRKIKKKIYFIGNIRVNIHISPDTFDKMPLAKVRYATRYNTIFHRGDTCIKLSFFSHLSLFTSLCRAGARHIIQQ